MRPLRHALLIDRRPQQIGESRGGIQRVAGGCLVAGENDRIGGRRDSVRHCRQRPVGRANARIDPRGPPEVYGLVAVQDVSGQGDEYRPGRRSRRHLGGAPQDARQVLDPGDFHGPLDDGFRNRGERGIEQRLREPVTLFLLARGHDDRRAALRRGVERADGVSQSRRDMHIAGRKLSGRPRETVGHGDNHRFLQAQHIAEVALFGQRMHDR